MITLADRTLLEMIEATPDALIATDEDGTIVLFNNQAETLFGYSRAEALGLPVEALIPERLRDHHPAYRDAFTADPKARPMGVGLALTARRKDGSEFAAEISLSFVRAEAGLIAMAAIRDFVDERLDAQRDRERLGAQMAQDQLEGELQQSRRIESLGLLAGGIAHDFNNELAIIQNYVSFAQEALADTSKHADAAAVMADLATAAGAAERAEDLVRQLLAFGRREVVQPELLDVNVVVETVGNLLARTVKAGIELTVSCGAMLSPVFLDPGQLRQVLLNLAHNAVQAMPHGGKLTIDTENVVPDKAEEVDGQPVAGAPYVRLRVADTGIGMPPEVQQRAFEPFYTTKAVGEGTGLGLSTVYGIVKQARGTVQIHSQEDVGTTVSVLLPAADNEPATVAAVDSAAAPAPASETVLVVDDTTAALALAARILADGGYTVLRAASGADALRVSESHDGPIAALLTDVVMPKMGGRAVAEAIIAMRPQIRVLFMSGYAEDLMTDENVLLPGVVLVAEPFTRSELLAQVRAVLETPPPLRSPGLVSQRVLRPSSGSPALSRER